MKKLASILLSACFLLNIAWTSGYASVTEDLLKKRNIKEIASPHATAAVSPGQMPLSPRESAQGVTAVKTEIGYDLKDARGNTVGFYDEATGKVTKKDPEGKTVVYDRSELDENFNLKKEVPRTSAVTQAAVKQERQGAGVLQSDDKKQIAGAVAEYVGGWLQEYANADAGKKAAMAATLGLSVSQLADLSAEAARKIGTYLQGQGENVINCAISALGQILSLNGRLFSVKETAQEAILVDVLTGSLKAPEAGREQGQMQLSMFAVQKTAQLHGVQLDGYATDVAGLQEAVAGGRGAIAHLDLGDGMGHFVTVTAVQDGNISYVDSDGKTSTVSQEAFARQWSGKLLTKEAVTGTALAVNALQETRGALSSADSKLSSSDRSSISKAQSDYNSAKSRGDSAGMAKAHAAAEAVRSRNGYSGGADGSGYHPTGGGSRSSGSGGSSHSSSGGSSHSYAPQMSTNDSNAIAGYQAAYQRAAAVGNTAAMAAAHAGAEAVRARYNYSGGADGSAYIPKSPATSGGPVISYGSSDLVRASEHLQYFGSKEAYAVAIQSKEKLGLSLSDAAAAAAFKAANASLFTSSIVNSAVNAITREVGNITRASMTGYQPAVDSVNSLANAAIAAATQVLGRDSRISVNNTTTPVVELSNLAARAVTSAVTGVVADQAQRNINSFGGAENYYKAITDKLQNNEELSDPGAAQYFLGNLSRYGFAPVEDRVKENSEYFGGIDNYFSAITRRDYSYLVTGKFTFSDLEAAKYVVEHARELGVSANLAVSNGNDVLVNNGWHSISSVNDEKTVNYTLDSRLEMNYAKLDEAQYNQYRATVNDYGVPGAKGFLKQTGAYKNETLYDGRGREVYTARNAGYAVDGSGKATMAVQYDFAQAYDDNYYMKGANAGDAKLSIETYNEYRPQEAIIHEIEKGSGVSRVTLNSGLKVSVTGSIGALEQVSRWENDAADPNRVLVRSVEFAEGKPSALETVSLARTSAGLQLNFVERYLLDNAYRNAAVKNAQPVNGGADAREGSVLGQFAGVLNAADGIKIDNYSYAGFKYIDDKYIDINSAMMLTYSPGNPAASGISGVDAGTGARITVRNVDFGQNWRSDWRIVTGARSMGTVEFSASDRRGDTGKATVLATSNITFHSEKDLFDCSYSFADRTKNTATVIETGKSGTKKVIYEDVEVDAARGTFAYNEASNVFERRYDSDGKLVDVRDSYAAGKLLPMVLGPSDTPLDVSKVSAFSVDKRLDFHWVLAGDKFALDGFPAKESFTGTVKGSFVDDRGTRYEGYIRDFRLEEHNGTLGVWGVLSQGQGYAAIPAAYDGAQGQKGAGADIQGNKDFAPSAEIVAADARGIVFNVDPSRQHNGIQILHGALSPWKAGAEYDFAGGEMKVDKRTYFGGNGAHLSIVGTENGGTNWMFKNTSGREDWALRSGDTIYEVPGGRQKVVSLGDHSFSLSFKTDDKGIARYSNGYDFGAVRILSTLDNTGYASTAVDASFRVNEDGYLTFVSTLKEGDFVNYNGKSDGAAGAGQQKMLGDKKFTPGATITYRDDEVTVFKVDPGKDRGIQIVGLVGQNLYAEWAKAGASYALAAGVRFENRDNLTAFVGKSDGSTRLLIGGNGEFKFVSADIKKIDSIMEENCLVMASSKLLGLEEAAVARRLKKEGIELDGSKTVSLGKAVEAINKYEKDKLSVAETENGYVIGKSGSDSAVLIQKGADNVYHAEAISGAGIAAGARVADLNAVNAVRVAGVWSWIKEQAGKAGDAISDGADYVREKMSAGVRRVEQIISDNTPEPVKQFARAARDTAAREIKNLSRTYTAVKQKAAAVVENVQKWTGGVASDFMKGVSQVPNGLAQGMRVAADSLTNLVSTPVSYQQTMTVQDVRTGQNVEASLSVTGRSWFGGLYNTYEANGQKGSRWFSRGLQKLSDGVSPVNIKLGNTSFERSSSGNVYGNDITTKIQLRGVNGDVTVAQKVERIPYAFRAAGSAVEPERQLISVDITNGVRLDGMKPQGISIRGADGISRAVGTITPNLMGTHVGMRADINGNTTYVSEDGRYETGQDITLPVAKIVTGESRTVTGSGNVIENTRYNENWAGMTYDGAGRITGGYKDGQVQYVVTNKRDDNGRLLEGLTVAESGRLAAMSYYTSGESSGRVQEIRWENLSRKTFDSADSSKVIDNWTARGYSEKYEYTTQGAGSLTTRKDYAVTELRDFEKGTVATVAGTHTQVTDRFDRVTSNTLAYEGSVVKEGTSLVDVGGRTVEADDLRIVNEKVLNEDRYSYREDNELSKEKSLHTYNYVKYDRINGSVSERTGEERYRGPGDVVKTETEKEYALAANDQKGEIRLQREVLEHQWNVVEGRYSRSGDYDRWTATVVAADPAGGDELNKVVHETGHSETTVNAKGQTIDLRDSGNRTVYRLSEDASLTAYDDKGRMWNEVTADRSTVRGNAVANGQYSDHKYDFAYDALGRTTQYRMTDKNGAAAETHLQYTYRAASEQDLGTKGAQTMVSVNGAKPASYSGYDFDSSFGPIDVAMDFENDRNILESIKGARENLRTFTEKAVDTGVKIGNWFQDNWKGLATATAVGAGLGAGAGAAVGGVGAIPGAIIGAILGAGNYVLGNLLSGGKGGGYTGNQVADGAISGLLSCFTLVTGGAGLVATSANVASKAITVGKMAVNAGFIASSGISASRNIREGNYLGAAMDGAMTAAFFLKPIHMVGKIAETSRGAAKAVSGAATAAESVTWSQRAAASGKLAAGLGALSGASNVLTTVGSNIAAGQDALYGIDAKSVAQSVIGGAVVGGLLGGLSPRLSQAWTSKNMLGTLEGYRAGGLTLREGSVLSTALQTGRDLALFNASPFGAGFNLVMANIQDKEFGMKEYAESIRNGFGFGLLVGPLFSMAMPGEYLGRPGGKLNTMAKDWGERGPLAAVNANLLGGKLSGVVPQWYRNAQGTMFGQQLKMVEMVAQYQVAGQVMGLAGSQLDKLFLTNGKEGQPGMFSKFLSDFSFFLVPTRTGRSVSEARMSQVLLGGGKDAVALSREILFAGENKGVEFTAGNGKKYSFDGASVANARGMAEAINLGEGMRLSMPDQIEIHKAIAGAAGKEQSDKYLTLGNILPADSGLLAAKPQLKNVVATELLVRGLTESVFNDIVGKRTDRERYDRLNEIVQQYEQAPQAAGNAKERLLDGKYAVTETLKDMALKEGYENFARRELDKSLQEGAVKDPAGVSRQAVIEQGLKNALAGAEKSDPLKAFAIKNLLGEVAYVRNGLNRAADASRADAGLSARIAKVRDAWVGTLLEGAAPEGNAELSRMLRDALSDKVKAEIAALRNRAGELKSGGNNAVAEQYLEASIEAYEKELNETLATNRMQDQLALLARDAIGATEKIFDNVALLSGKNEFSIGQDRYSYAFMKEGSAQGVEIDKNEVTRFLDEHRALLDRVAQQHEKMTLREGTGRADAGAVKDALANEFFGKGSFESLSLPEKLLLTFGIVKSELVKNDVTDATDKVLAATGKEKVEDLSPSQLAALKKEVKDARANLEAGFNDKIHNQMTLALENLVGNIGALLAGGGKSVVYYSVLSLLPSLSNGKRGVAEFLVAKETDIPQLMTGVNKNVADALGLNVVNGTELYKMQEKGLKELADIYESAGPETVVIYDLHSRGFVELASKSDANLSAALDKLSSRVIDEADVAALSRVSFVLGTGKVAPESFVNRVEGLREKVEDMGASYREAAEFNAADENAPTFTFENGKVIYSKALAEKLEQLDAEFGKPLIDNFFRAKYAFENKGREVGFADGQPVPIGNGREQHGTIDNSATYNVALVLMKIRQLGGPEAAKKEGFSKDNIKISASSGEATLSQVFRRQSEKILTFGGSATVDVAAEIAKSIYGSRAVGVESRTVKDDYRNSARWGTYNIKKYNESVLQKEQIAQIATDAAMDRIVNGHPDEARLLMGEWNVNVQRDVLFNVLEKMLPAGARGQKFESFAAFREAMIDGGEFGLSRIRDGFVEEFGGIGVNSGLAVKGTKAADVGALVRETVRIIDAEASAKDQGARGEGAQRSITDIAKDTNEGRVIFTNESGLRAVSFKKIDLMLLDAQNFNEGDLLQALGRAGRNKGYNSSITVLGERAGIETNVARAKEMIGALRKLEGKISDPHIRELERLVESVETAQNGKAMKEAMLDLSTKFSSLQQKTDSILFKAANESMQLLLKDPVNTMLNAARGRDREKIEKAFLDIITRDEAALRAEGKADKGYQSPMENLKNTFDSQKEYAIKEFEKLARQVEDPVLKREIEWRIEDLRASDFDRAWAEANRESTKTFTEVQADARGSIMEGKSPAQQVAEVLANLGKSILPLESAGGVEKTEVRLDTAVQQLNVAAGHDKIMEALRARKLTYDRNGEEYVNAQGIKLLSAAGSIANPRNMLGQELSKKEKREFYASLQNFFAAMEDNAGTAKTALPQVGLAASENTDRAVAAAAALLDKKIDVETAIAIGKASALLQNAGASLNSGDVKRVAEAKHPPMLAAVASDRNVALPQAQAVELAKILREKLQGASGGAGRDTAAARKFLNSLVQPYAQAAGIVGDLPTLPVLQTVAGMRLNSALGKLSKLTGKETATGTLREVSAAVSKGLGITDEAGKERVTAALVALMPRQFQFRYQMEQITSAPAEERKPVYAMTPGELETGVNSMLEGAAINVDTLFRGLDATGQTKEEPGIEVALLGSGAHAKAVSVRMKPSSQANAAEGVPEPLAGRGIVVKQVEPRQAAVESVVRGAQLVESLPAVRPYIANYVIGVQDDNGDFKALESNETPAEPGTVYVLQEKGDTLQNRLEELLAPKSDGSAQLSKADVKEAIRTVEKAVAHLAMLEKNGVGYVPSSGRLLENIGVEDKDGAKEKTAVVCFDFANLEKVRSYGASLVQMLNELDRLSLASLPAAEREEVIRQVKAPVLNAAAAVVVKEAMPFISDPSVSRAEKNSLLLSALGITLKDLRKASVDTAQAVISRLQAKETSFEETRSKSLFGVIKPGEENAFVRVVLLMCANTGELYGKLGIDYDDRVKNGGASIADISRKYAAKANMILELEQNKELTAEEAEIWMGIYQTVRDLLIAVNIGRIPAERLDKPKIDLAEINDITNALAVTRKETGMLSAQEVAKWAQSRQEKGEDVKIVVDESVINELRSAVEQKRGLGWFGRMWTAIGVKFGAEQTLEDRMKDVLKNDQLFDDKIIENRGRAIMDPLSIKGVIMSA